VPSALSYLIDVVAASYASTALEIRMRLNAILHAFTPWDDLSAVRFIIWNAANNASCEETTRAFLWFTAIQRVKRK
jgi:hypothetical protein